MADQVIKLRCSALPRAFKCAGSVRSSDLAINERGDAADMGTAAHDGAARLVAAGHVDWDGLPDLAKRHSVPEQELRGLLAQAQKLWGQVCASFPNATTEQELEYDFGFVVLTGHADILGSSDGEIRVGDWKFGRKDVDHSEQLRGYAALAMLKADAGASTAGVLWVRDGEYEHYTMGADDLEPWLERLRTEVVEWDGTYRPGGHCAHCPRNHECPAANALVRRDVAAISDKELVARVEDSEALATMTPEEIVDVLEKADVVSKYADRVRAAIRLHVMRNGDIVGRGRRLTLQHEERRSVDPLLAFPVLVEHGFEDPEMAEVLDISLAKAEKVAQSKAPKGKGAAAVRALKAALGAAEAVRTTTISKLVVKRA